MIKEQDRIWSFLKWLLFLCALQSFGAWFFWWIPDIFFQLFTFMVCATIVFIKGNKSRNNSVWFFLYSLAYLLKIFTQGFPNINGLLAIVLHLFSLYVIFSLPSAYKHDLFVTFRKGFTAILAVSVVFWVLHLIGISTPYTTVQFGTLDEGGYQYEYHNHYFYLVPVTLVFEIFPRFYSVFIEPGYLGCLMAIFLFLGQYRFSKGNLHNWVFLAALFFTFSLAGWGLAFLGFVMTKMQGVRHKFLLLATIFLSFFVAKYIAETANDGDNLINLLIFNRLEIDETTGIVGNHRFSESLNYEFWNHFIYGDHLWFGGVDVSSYSSFYSASNEVTAIAYIMQYGLISFLFLVVYFFYPILTRNTNRFLQFSFSLLFFLVFAQTIHLAHSLMYISMLVIGSNEIRLDANSAGKKSVISDNKSINNKVYVNI